MQAIEDLYFCLRASKILDDRCLMKLARIF